MLQPVSPSADLPPKAPAAPAAPLTVSTLSPFAFPAFRIIWIANLFANLGTWAQSVAAAWIITTEQSSPLMVAMIQVAAAFPLVALSILTGVLADNYDRRKVMLAGMLLELAGGVFITILAFAGLLHPITLIASVFCIAIGSAVVTPAWQAAVGEQVPREHVGSAVLLNSVNFNVARAVGPAIGGLLLGAMGAPWVFLLNCVCYGALVWAIWRWRRVVPVRRLPPEGLLEGVVAALRYTQHSTVTRVVMLRSFAFGLSASALWALLPLLAHEHADGSALLYGYMLGALGVGAILGSVVVRRIRQAWGASALITVAAALLAVCLAALGLTDTLWVAFPALLVSGSCWIGVLATYNTTVQLLVPDWVKARSLALYQTAIFGGLAAGSFMWGHFAGTMGVSGALTTAGIMLGITVALLYRSRLPEHVDAQSLARVDDVEPAMAAAGFNTQHGAVLVAVEYQIDQDKLRALIAAAHPLRLLRLRNGAQQWQLFRDLEREGIWREVFLVESWMQYLRMIDRMTLADKMVLDEVRALHGGEQPPVVSRNVSYLAMNEAQGFSLRRHPEAP
ncbi:MULTISPECIES: MFS transporter [Achromobacter]|uniref:Enterobactin exporter EntS n=1 Tax=Achromobacter piechaudii TaxID=72556 RepID=A0A6S7CJ65_9BURK|nr:MULTISPECIES: MFS transporter [Achromobacter]MPS80498.1 MFS transporter [Achromobacter sp.]CAB3821178.1 Enterobactin exporter EntS [Achromobacter piechaudii]CAB3850469.1 Enterobactin exporter EntS [Achromobacter piechaudii]CAB3945579.1 Enterobactin exporter EntS [Achromobacter piechaudii]